MKGRGFQLDLVGSTLASTNLTIVVGSTSSSTTRPPGKPDLTISFLILVFGEREVGDQSLSSRSTPRWPSPAVGDKEDRGEGSDRPSPVVVSPLGHGDQDEEARQRERERGEGGGSVAARLIYPSLALFPSPKMKET